MKKLFLLLLSFLIVLTADNNNSLQQNSTITANEPLKDINSSKTINIKKEKSLDDKREIELKRKEIKTLNEKLKDIDKKLNNDIMYAKYNNHQTYLKLKETLKEVNKKIDKAERFHHKKELTDFKIQQKSLENQIALLEDFSSHPFEYLTKPQDIKPTPKVDSPFSIFEALTYIKKLKKDSDEYNKELKSLLSLIDRLEMKNKILTSVSKIMGDKYRKDLREEIRKELDEIISSYDIANSTNKLYNKKVQETIHKVTNDVKEQFKKLLNIAAIILAIILLSFLFKYFAKKTISDNQRYYMAHKVINFTNVALISMVLLFSFLEHATSLITILGFASAGIAIAMKDLFMSLLGWFVIVFGGSFHVGDRIKVYKGGKSYVGDIVDISFLRMTILEDITLTTYVENRRSGRVVFIPNNYVFTELLANYTHGKIKTVWDGIDVTITFDSNHKKATHIIKSIVKKYSKGYTDISRKQLNLLRNQYSLKNINVEPRIYTFIEKYGITVSCWYMTNSYAALTLRSNISAQIIDELNQEDDIKIAYETHVVNMKRDREIPKELKEEGEEESLS